MAFGYPVSLEVTGRRAVVVGEQAVAHGKADVLLAAGAEVLVVAEGPADELDRLEQDERVAVARREFEPSDLDDAFVCVAHSDDPEQRAAVHREARRRGVLVNVMDDNRHCDFAAPAVVRRGDLMIAISTGGRSPALARRLRIELEERFGPEWEEALEVIGAVREVTVADMPDVGERARRWEEALDLEEVLALVREGRSADAGHRLRGRLLGNSRGAA